MSNAIDVARNLTKKHITILRKSWLPAYFHSRSVWDKLLMYWFPQDIIVAWILHDIVEDSDMTLSTLKDLWYSDYIVNLVDYVTHDDSILDKNNKRSTMMLRCIEGWSAEVWWIKIADYRDNITDFYWCSKEFVENMLLKKGPMFVYYGNKHYSGTVFYDEFMEEYRKQIKTYHNYFI